MASQLQHLLASSGFFGGNAPFIEGLYEKFLHDPSSVPADWRQRFEQLPQVNTDGTAEPSHEAIRLSFQNLARHHRAPQAASSVCLPPAAAAKQAAVLRLINAHRVRGHQNARLSPIQLQEMTPLPELSLAYHGLSEADLDNHFNTGSLMAPDQLPLRDILAMVQEVYTGAIGAEYMHITSTEQKRWIQQRLEVYRGHPELKPEDRVAILVRLTAAEGLEKYLHTRYVGQKRFSLEGGESLIPLLDELIQRAGNKGAGEIVIGMAHRGRLNVLTNILGKPPREMFEEFEGYRKSHHLMSSGDVKYHKGFASQVETPGGIINVVLGFNPSHLEIIGPVVQGSVRCRQRRRKDHRGDKVLPVVIHGDASFAGQGVVMETFNMSQARGFTTGGTVHIVVNNQIGFTTSDPLDSRSTTYCTDVAKMVQAPIFHVNGDDPEAVIFITRLALDYRNRFHRDIVIDLVCYRRHGHNEADEPAVTQPMMYQVIRSHPTVRTRYTEQLLAAGVLTPEQAQAMVDDYRRELEQGTIVSRPVLCDIDNRYVTDWKPFNHIHWSHPAETGVDSTTLQRLALKLLELPEDWVLHPRVERIMQDRRRMANGEQEADWGFAENLAYATLLNDGYPVRLSGQDCRRGTFFHRHATLHDQESGRSHTPLQHLGEEQPDFVVIDSLLSEEAVLAFEYGYASAEPYGLTLWEAQFGDFANGAQVVIDQFISSAGAKWGLYCGLSLLLPHGYEGQGPEHSSARIERYMQLCAEHNIQVCVPTTPAQIFHLLRRQMVRPYRRPLIVMTPKSLLRHPLAVSPLELFHQGSFHNVIGECDPLDPARITQVVMCSGKVYYDLLQARRARGIDHVAIIRLEQLYPFPYDEFDAVTASFPHASTYVWCQEEPQNQGAWDLIKHRFASLRINGREVHYVGRSSAAAPATGYHRVHHEEQEKLINDALNGTIDPSQNRRIFP